MTDFTEQWLWPNIPSAIDYTNLPCSLEELDAAVIAAGWIKSVKVEPLSTVASNTPLAEALEAARVQWYESRRTGGDRALTAAHAWHRIREQMSWWGQPTTILTLDQWRDWKWQAGGDSVYSASCFVSAYEIERYLTNWAIRLRCWSAKLADLERSGAVVTHLGTNVSLIEKRGYEIESLFLSRGRKKGMHDVTVVSVNDVMGWNELSMRIDEYGWILDRLLEFRRLAEAGVGYGIGRTAEGRALSRQTKLLCNQLMTRYEGAVRIRLWPILASVRSEAQAMSVVE